MARRYHEEPMYIDETGEACQSGSEPIESNRERMKRNKAFWDALTPDQQEIRRRCNVLERDRNVNLYGGELNCWMQRFYNSLPGADTSVSLKHQYLIPLVLNQWEEFVEYTINGRNAERSEYENRYGPKPK